MVIACCFNDEGEMGGEVCDFSRHIVPEMYTLVIRDSTSAVFLVLCELENPIFLINISFEKSSFLRNCEWLKVNEAARGTKEGQEYSCSGILLAEET